MTKKILLICLLLSLVKCPEGEALYTQEMVQHTIQRTVYILGTQINLCFCVNFPRTGTANIDPEMLSSEIMNHLDLSKTLLHTVTRPLVEDIKIEDIRTPDDCSDVWLRFWFQIRGQPDSVKEVFYAKHKSKLDELEGFLRKAISENGGQTSVDIERANSSRLIFLIESPEPYPTYERVLPFPSTLLIDQDPDVSLRALLQDHRIKIAGLQHNDSYALLERQERFIKMELKKYQKPGCSGDKFEFMNPELKHIEPEVHTLVERLEKLRAQSPTRLEKFIKEYSVYLGRLQRNWPTAGGFMSHEHETRHAEFYNYVEQKLLTDKVDESINEVFELHNKWLYPQLLEALIILFKIGLYSTKGEVPRALIRLIVPGEGVVDIERRVKKWIRVIADGKTYREVDLDTLKYDHMSVLTWAKTEPSYAPVVLSINSFVTYLNKKACQFIIDGYEIKPGFYDLPSEMMT